MPQVRLFTASDSINELTGLLHRAYARLGDMGLNYTAVDQSAEVTAQRIRGGTCYVASLADTLVGTIVVQPTYAQNECEYFTRPGVAAAHQFAVEPSRQSGGIGRMLLVKAESWAVENGFHEQVGWVQWPGKVYRSVVLSKRLPS